jgi:hypothetical protein
MQWSEKVRGREQWVWGGWTIGPDDDVPRPPELSPLDFAQAQRAVKHSAPAGTAQPKLN